MTEGLQNRTASKCQCGQLSVKLPGPSASVVACHCSDCQRRSGSPFGVLAYYSDECVKIAGEATRYERPTATGGTFETFFCPTCGSTVYARAGKHPTLIRIAVGAICDPTYSAPVRSNCRGGHMCTWSGELKKSMSVLPVSERWRCEMLCFGH
jgi:hypothetical protein